MKMRGEEFSRSVGALHAVSTNEPLPWLHPQADQMEWLVAPHARARSLPENGGWSNLSAVSSQVLPKSPNPFTDGCPQMAVNARKSTAAPPPGPTRIAIITPVHGPLGDAARALKALGNLIPPPDECILVVDTRIGSPAKALLPAGSRWVEVPFRSGPARARNAGAATATADLLLFIDADVEVPVDTVGRVRAEFAARPETAALFGSYDDDPGDPGFLSQYRNLLHHYVHQSSRCEAFTFWAGLGAVRTGAFRSVGGFDDRFTAPSIEDIELGGRLRRAGHGIRIVKELQGRHLKRWTAMGMLRVDLLQRGIPWVRLILAQRDAPKDLNLDVTARLSTALAALAAGLALLAMWQPRWGAASAACVAWLVVLNRGFYGFLAKQRGARFALRSIPWHYLFYLECGLAALFGMVLHIADRLRSPASHR